MRNAQKPDHRGLNTIVSWLKEGKYIIPDFQREFEWEPWDIQALMRSIFLDYYIGNLLLWKSKPENFKALSCEDIYGYSGDKRPEYIVLDGQQRLTALYYAFLAPDINLPRRSSRAFYFILVDRFMDEEYDEAFTYEWQNKTSLKLMADPKEQYLKHKFPLSVIGAGGWHLSNWAQGYETFWRNKAQEARDAGNLAEGEIATQNADNANIFGNYLNDIGQEYQISYIELDQDLAIDKICDIFTQINSRGIRLDVFDLMNAILKPKNLQLKKMWREAKPRLSFAGTERMNIYILQVMSILSQAYCSPKYLYYLLPGQEKAVRDRDGTRRKEILISDSQEFKEKWENAVNSIESSIKILRHPQEYGVISAKYLPYVSILPAFSALQAFLKTLPAEDRLKAKKKVQHWYWASIFTSRYSGSVESTSARDFLDVRAWIEDSDAEPSLIQEFKLRFADLDLRRETKRGSSIYNGIFNLLVINGARDWITGDVSLDDDLDDHHIIPVSWGEANLEKNRVHTILNRTPLTEDTNRNIIRDRLPNSYLPELIERNGESRVKEILESNFISSAALEILLRDPFTPDDYEAFITERQRTIQQAIESLLIKERLDLIPLLRDLDEKIEQVELGLRKLIVTAMGNDLSAVPRQFLEKAEGRLQGAVRKNPSLDSEQLDTLAGKLEFSDLREVQNIITSKALWQNFESYFRNKEALNGKFNQLAELRNNIRHSRSVDDITRMEGEAAILWFEQVLNI